MRGSSAALKPTSTAGIFVGYSLTSDKYIVCEYSTCAVVERTRVDFNSDVFPNDSSGAVVSTNKISVRPPGTGSPARLHDDESPASTEPATTKVTASGPLPSATTQLNVHDMQIRNSVTETKLPCTYNNDTDVHTHME